MSSKHPNPDNPFGLRHALAQDIDRAKVVSEIISRFGPHAIALYLATALNERDEHENIVRNQRKRLAELQIAANEKPDPRIAEKYYAPKDSGDVLQKIRSIYAT